MIIMARGMMMILAVLLLVVVVAEKGRPAIIIIILTRNISGITQGYIILFQEKDIIICVVYLPYNFISLICFLYL